MLKLEELKTKNVKFRIDSIDKEFEVRPINLADVSWLRETIGEDIEKELSDIKNICRLTYHQLVDKSDFKPQKISDYDENGNETKLNIGGYRLMMSYMGATEVKELVEIMTELIKNSMPKAQEKELKKKVEKEK